MSNRPPPRSSRPTHPSSLELTAARDDEGVRTSAQHHQHRPLVYNHRRHDLHAHVWIPPPSHTSLAAQGANNNINSSSNSNNISRNNIGIFNNEPPVLYVGLRDCDMVAPFGDEPLRTNGARNLPAAPRPIDPVTETSLSGRNHGRASSITTTTTASNGASRLPATAAVTDPLALSGSLVHEIVDATDIAVVMSEHDEEVLLQKRRNRFLKWGAISCALLAWVIVLPVWAVMAGISPNLVLVNDTAPESSMASPTQTPTSAPTSVQVTELINFLMDLQSPAIDSALLYQTDPDSLTSPSYKAVLWLAQEDTFWNEYQQQSTSAAAANNNTATNDDSAQQQQQQRDHIVQRYAVVTFYYATHGHIHWKTCSQRRDGCLHPTPWLTVGVNECEWAFIECDGGGSDGDESNIEMIKSNDAEGHLRRDVITELQFPSTGNNLQGTLPLELSLLTALRRLYVPTNQLAGSSENLRQATAGLSNLEVLVFEGNQLKGSLPEALIARNTQLEILSLARNQFTGTIPSTWTASLSRLTDLQLHDNFLTGVIPSSLGMLSGYLRNLHLHNNDLRGLIPNSLYDLTQLTSLWISHNQQLSGPFDPTRISNWSRIQTLRAANTQIDGSLTDEMFDAWGQIEWLELENAHLTGTLSNRIALWNATLVDLALQNNQLTGSVPQALMSLTKLSNLQLEGNGLTGTIPDAICARRGKNFSQLETLTVDCHLVACSCCSDGEKNNCRT